jgi:hypothetical protein
VGLWSSDLSNFIFLTVAYFFSIASFIHIRDESWVKFCTLSRGENHFRLCTLFSSLHTFLGFVKKFFYDISQRRRDPGYSPCNRSLGSPQNVQSRGGQPATQACIQIQQFLDIFGYFSTGFGYQRALLWGPRSPSQI